MPQGPVTVDAPLGEVVAEVQDQRAAPRVWTLDEAFSVLRQALAAHYDQADNLPAYLLCMELQVVYDNAGGMPTHGNCVAAWQQIILLLENVVGVNLRRP